MKQGVIVGGWQYVWMAYGLTFSVLVFYGISLIARLREARRREG
jgi:hypothetical protein